MERPQRAIAEYRPNFVLWTSFLAQLPLQFFFALWAGVFFGGLLSVLLPSTANRAIAHVGSPFLMIGTAVLLLFPLVALTAKWLNYNNTVYRVYVDRVEIEEGVLTLRRKDVPFVSVREINLRRGILQRFVGLGSIHLATAATSQGQWSYASAMIGGTSTFGSGAMLMDLASANAAYEQLRELIERGRPTGQRLESPRIAE